MAKSITVKIEGQAETVKGINMFNMEMRQDLIKVVQSTMRAVGKSGRANAPISKTPKSKGSPGDLKKSIRGKSFDGGLSATVVPRRPKGAHRHLVEYGTKRRTTKSGANRGKMPANPFMGPAESANDAKYNQKIRGLVERDKTI